MGAPSSGVTNLISVDLSNAGWIDIYYKKGSTTEARLISYKAPANTTSFHSFINLVKISNYIQTNAETCEGIKGSGEVKVRVLVDGSAADLDAKPNGWTTCGTFDKTSYDSSTKIASLKYDVAGAAVNHTIKTYDKILPSSFNTSPSTYSSLKLDDSGKYFTDWFNSGAEADKTIYFSVSSGTDDAPIPKNTPWPLASAIFDFSKADINMKTAGTVFDTSATDFKTVAHKLAELTKDKSFTLYVPYRDGDKFVGVCAGAADLAAVNDKCTGVYYLSEGKSKTHKDTKSIPDGKTVKASLITVGAKKFWQIDGLTGSGGFSANITEDPATGISVNTMSTPIVLAAIAGTIAVALGARRLSIAKSKK